VAIPALVSAVLGFWNLGRPSMYGTEAVTYWAAHLPLPTLLHVTSNVDAVHATYYLLMHFVFLLGGGTFFLRLPSVLGMVAAVAMTAVLARRLTGSDRVALFAGLALAIAPVAGSYAQAGRSYAIDTAAVTLACYLFLRAIDSPAADRRAWHQYTLALVACAYLHEMTLLMIAAHAVTLAWSRVPREVLWRWMRASLWGVLGSALVIVESVMQSGQVSWIKPANWVTVRGLYQTLLGPGRFALVLNVSLIAVAVLVSLRRGGPGITVGRLALPILVVAPALLIGESAVGTPLYGGVRYLIWCAPAAALLVGFGLDQVLALATLGRVTLVGAMIGALLLGATLHSQWATISRQHSDAGLAQNLLAEASFISSHAHPGDGIIFSPRDAFAAELGFPHDFTSVRDLVLKESGSRSGSLYGTSKSAADITAAIDASPRVWLVGSRLSSAAKRPGLGALKGHFRVMLTHHVRGVQITLLERRAGR
jgi:mannosyltransferase